MTKLFLIITLIIVGVNTSGSKTFIEDRAALLTGNNSKSWYLYIPAGADQSMKKVLGDNTYTFFSNGAFEFDHGTVFEDVDCKDDDCFNDILSVQGKWEFTNNQNGLRITALHEKGHPENAQTLVLYDATIVSLTETVLKISQKDPETNISYTMEFRKK